MCAATPANTAKTATTLDCLTERGAAELLGYNRESWDTYDNIDIQPASYGKAWKDLSSEEKAAARVLGYTATSYNDQSGENEPASASKKWAELATELPTGCGECPDIFVDKYNIGVFTLFLRYLRRRVL